MIYKPDSKSADEVFDLNTAISQAVLISRREANAYEQRQDSN